MKLKWFIAVAVVTLVGHYARIKEDQISRLKYVDGLSGKAAGIQNDQIQELLTTEELGGGTIS